MTRNSSGPSSATITRAEGSEGAAAAGSAIVPAGALAGGLKRTSTSYLPKIRLRAPIPVSSTAAFKCGVPCKSAITGMVDWKRRKSGAQGGHSGGGAPPRAIHAEWAKADRRVIRDGVEKGPAGDAPSGLHYQRRIVRPAVGAEDLQVSEGRLVIDVGRDGLDGRRIGFPQVQHVRHGAAAGISFAGTVEALPVVVGPVPSVPHVDVCRQGVDRFSGGGHLVDVA